MIDSQNCWKLGLGMVREGVADWSLSANCKMSCGLRVLVCVATECQSSLSREYLVELVKQVRDAGDNQTALAFLRRVKRLVPPSIRVGQVYGQYGDGCTVEVIAFESDGWVRVEFEDNGEIRLYHRGVFFDFFREIIPRVRRV